MTRLEDRPLPQSTEECLKVADLAIDVLVDGRFQTIIRDVGFMLRSGQTLTLVGESGSGKTMTSEALIGMLTPGVTRISNGQLQYRGESVLPNRLELLQQLRGSKICLVPQDPLGALNPSFTVGWQVSEILRSRFGVGRRDAKRRALALLEQVQLDRPKERYRQYPHQLSGGMRQRVLIAIALAPGPDVLILDEPTTALDVSVEAEILRLLLDLQRERNMAVLLVTHDLGVAAVMSDEVAVMYGGRIAEIGPASEILQRPVHPYTQGLVASVPRIDGELTELRPIGGEPPVLTDLPRGCPFATRCPEVFERCWDDAPDLLPITNAQHLVACHRRRPVDMSIASSKGGSS